MIQDPAAAHRDDIHSDEPDPRDWLAAIIAGSQDAIISKDLSGRIRSWNDAAVRLFGYHADEVIGKSITMLIPKDRLDEEARILAEIRQGRRVEHFETERVKKDGSIIELSLTISPIRNAAGVVVGASKIARDITARREAEEHRQLLLGEMRHRVKNLFALATAIVSFSTRAKSADHDVVEDIRARLGALSRAHELTMSNWQNEAAGAEYGDLPLLIQAILEPYQDGDCFVITGDSAKVGTKAATNVALLVHELATNAAKYGALSVPEGRLSVKIAHKDDFVDIEWTEIGSPPPSSVIAAGFGSRLETGLIAALGATISRDWRPDGLSVSIGIPRTALEL